LSARIRNIIEALSANIWMVPLLFLLGAIGLAVLNFYLDKTLLSEQAQFLEKFPYFKNADNIRTLLSVSATSILGVAGVSFSITVASLTLASQQFGPRLLRNFMMDRFNQVVLGVFTGTFLYCIMMLQLTGSMDLEKTTPLASMIGLLILIFINLLMLLFFIHHIAVSIQADSVISNVNVELQLQLEKLFPELHDESQQFVASSKAVSQLKNESNAVFATSSGYLQAIDYESLMKLLTDKDIAIEIRVKPGDFIIQNSQIGRCLSKQPDQNKINDAINEYLLLGEKGSAEQDPEFAVRQLVEVAVRALSPGINDPFTAITCLDRLGDSLAFLTHRQFPSDQHVDEEGQLRLITKPFTFEGMVEASFNQIRQHGSSDMSVSIRLLDTLQCLAAQVRSAEQAKAISIQADALYFTLKANSHAKKDQDDIEARYQSINQCIESRFS